VLTSHNKNVVFVVDFPGPALGAWESTNLTRTGRFPASILQIITFVTHTMEQKPQPKPRACTVPYSLVFAPSPLIIIESLQAINSPSAPSSHLRLGSHDGCVAANARAYGGMLESIEDCGGQTFDAESRNVECERREVA